MKNTIKVLALSLIKVSVATAHPISIGADEIQSIEQALGSSSDGILQILTQYIGVGFGHIVPKGWDHVLFILTLVILNPAIKSLLLSVSLFTLAHSLTLGLSALGQVNAPGSLIEPLIAMSISFMALEFILPKKLQRLRYPIIFFFGLVHGLGFAGALSELGLPQKGFLSALVGFNLGVELGQLSIIVFWRPIVLWLKRQGDWGQRYGLVPLSIIIAITGGYWAIQRLHAPEVSVEAQNLGVIYFNQSSLHYPFKARVTPSTNKTNETNLDGLSSFELNDFAALAIRTARSNGNDLLYSEAAKAATLSLQLVESGNTEAQLILAEVLQAQHQFDKALTLLKSIETDVDALSLLVRIKLGQKDHESALRHAQALIAQIPSATSYLYLGLVLETMGKRDEAVEMYYGALLMEDIGEENASAWGRSLLARLYLRNGNLKEAKTAARYALAILPHYPLAQQVLREASH